MYFSGRHCFFVLFIQSHAQLHYMIKRFITLKTSKFQRILAALQGTDTTTNTPFRIHHHSPGFFIYGKRLHQTSFGAYPAHDALLTCNRQKTGRQNSPGIIKSGPAPQGQQGNNIGFHGVYSFICLFSCQDHLIHLDTVMDGYGAKGRCSVQSGGKTPLQ